MTENDGELPAAGRGLPGAAARGAAAAEPRKDQHPKPHEHFVSPGAESTRELREMARRRREAEEKLQQHLLEAKEKPAED